MEQKAISQTEPVKEDKKKSFVQTLQDEKQKKEEAAEKLRVEQLTEQIKEAHGELKSLQDEINANGILSTDDKKTLIDKIMYEQTELDKQDASVFDYNELLDEVDTEFQELVKKKEKQKKVGDVEPKQEQMFTDVAAQK